MPFAATVRSVCFLVSIAVVVPSALAQTVEVSIGEVRTAAGPPNGDDLAAVLAFALKEEFQKLDMRLDPQLELAQVPLDAYAQDLASTCPVPLPKRVRTDATTGRMVIHDSSLIVLDMPGIHQITLSADLEGHLEARANASVEWGQAIPFVGNCEKIGTDSGTVAVSLPFNLSLTLTASLAPQYDPEQVALVIDKAAALDGAIRFGRGTLDPEFGSVSITEEVIKALENYLLERLRAKGVANFERTLQALNYRLDGLDAAGAVDPDLAPFNGTSVFPLTDDASDRDLYRLVLAELRLPELLMRTLEERGADILLRLAALDDAGRRQLLLDLGSELACSAVRDRYEAPLPQSPLYTEEGGQCVAADPFGGELASYFRDVQCTAPVAFRPTPPAEFCAARLGGAAKQTLGNAAAWTAVADQPGDPLPAVPSRPWTTLPSTRLDIGTLPIGENFQPYVKAVRYKTVSPVERGDGTCALEMRIYKKSIAQTGLKPLLAIHGGTWRSRGFSFLGLEATISQFTERGFVVFAPFYRLVDTGDGNVECNGVTWREVVADVEDALQWVVDHGPAFGTDGSDVTLFGQSAGGQLAAWLATYQAEHVRKAMLLYAPLDVLAFLQGAVPAGGSFADFRDFGGDALARFYGAPEGAAQVQWDQIDYGGLTAPLLDQQWQTGIPEWVFALADTDPAAPPLFLARCAAFAGIDLTTIDLTRPPPALSACLQRDLADFVVANSFYHRLSQPAVPLYAIHGSGDTLVPHAQAVGLCDALDGGVRSPELAQAHTQLQCGQRSQVHLVRDAEHALDLGLCFGDALCPAGPPESETRTAAAAALAEGMQWLVQDAPALSPVGSGDNPTDPQPAPGVKPDVVSTPRPPDGQGPERILAQEDGGGGAGAPAALCWLWLWGGVRATVSAARRRRRAGRGMSRGGPRMN